MQGLNIAKICQGKSWGFTNSTRWGIDHDGFVKGGQSGLLIGSAPISDLHLLLCGFDEASERSILLPFVYVRQLMVLRLILELYIA